MKHADFLFELGCEDLPAGALQPMAEALATHVQHQLQSLGVGPFEPQIYYTPRRLAVLITALPLEVPGSSIERRGPAKAQGFNAHGHPTPALEGFLKSCQARLEDLREVHTDKGVWLAVTVHKPALRMQDVLPEIFKGIEKVLLASVKKTMRWGAHEVAFLRPVKWVVALLGAEIIPLHILGLDAGSSTYGHRFHHPHAVSLAQASDYVAALHQAFVMVDQAERRRTIITQAEALLPAQMQAKWASLEEVINLVEWPVPLLCQFEPEFLEVPERALIATMEANQRVFPVQNAAGQLQPYFIVVANIASKHPEEVIAGNEKVVRARLADARFFYQEDLKVPLEKQALALKNISFQQGLGSLWDKTERLAEVALSARAARLCKADLVAQMVQEFPELQGYMGHQYALLQGENVDVAQAIEDHYKPKGRGAELPDTAFGRDLALRDKLDTLVGLFSLGKEPTSSGDPYALRRQALGVIAILVEAQMDFDLHQALEQAYAAYAAQKHKLEAQGQVLAKLNTFFTERLEVWCRDEKALPMTVVKAILLRPTLQGFNPYSIFQCVEALDALLKTPEGRDIKELAKRVAHIVDAKSKQDLPEVALFQAAEQALWQLTLTAQTEHWLAVIDVKARYLKFLAFKQPLSDFFEQVLVNDADPRLKANRQALLKQLHALFLQLADFSQI